MVRFGVVPPLIAAGVDPEKTEGRAYAQVTVDIDGKPTDV
jgi:hypothetical protein